MPYVTSADMQLRFAESYLIQATNVGVSNPTTLNTARLDDACEAANAIADGYLIRRFVLPLDASSALLAPLKTHCANLAIEVLGGVMGTTDEIKRRADLAREWLEWLADADNELPSSYTPDITAEAVEDAVAAETDYTWDDARLRSILDTPGYYHY